VGRRGLLEGGGVLHGLEGACDLVGHQRVGDGQEDGDADGAAHLPEEGGGGRRDPDVP
jgi:hypothetical protein